jgi:ADP-heptose:LPS heptosyltransferase
MHILIVRPGAIGDTLLTLPVIQALKARYELPSITLVGNAAVLPLASATGIVDHVSNYELSQWGELFSRRGITTPSLQAQLQAVDLAICWLRDSDGIVANNLRRAGVREIITAPGRPAPGQRVHIMTYLAQTLGITLSQAQMSVGLPSLFPSSTTSERRLIAIHPGSGGSSKCWPVRNFAAVITALWQRVIPVLLLAGPADEDCFAELQKLLPMPPHPSLLHNLINAPLLEVAQHLSTCRGYLGNDAGITHLAALLGVPTLALFGPSDPAIWSPQGSAVRILHSPILGNLSDTVIMQELESLCL